MDDFLLTDDEVSQLEFIARKEGLTTETRQLIHWQWFKTLVSSASRDGFLSSGEASAIRVSADLLGIPRSAYEGALDALQTHAVVEVRLDGVQRITFTGDHPQWNRSHLETVARALSLEIGGVVKSKPCLVVATDPSSMSGKAAKAKQFGVPLCTVEAFLEAVNGDGLVRAVLTAQS